MAFRSLCVPGVFFFSCVTLDEHVSAKKELVRIVFPVAWECLREDAPSSYKALRFAQGDTC